MTSARPKVILWGVFSLIRKPHLPNQTLGHVVWGRSLAPFLGGTDSFRMFCLNPKMLEFPSYFMKNTGQNSLSLSLFFFFGFFCNYHLSNKYKSLTVLWWTQQGPVYYLSFVLFLRIISSNLKRHFKGWKPSHFFSCWLQGTKGNFLPLEGRLPLWLMENMHFNNIWYGTEFQHACSTRIITMKQAGDTGPGILEKNWLITIL